MYLVQYKPNTIQGDKYRNSKLERRNFTPGVQIVIFLFIGRWITSGFRHRHLCCLLSSRRHRRGFRHRSHRHGFRRRQSFYGH